MPSSQATTRQTHVNSHLASVAASPPSSHLSSGGTRDPGSDPVDPLLQLCPFSQSPWRGSGGQLPIWQVPWAPGPRFPPHCQHPHTWWHTFSEGMQNGCLSSQRNLGLRSVTEVKSVTQDPVRNEQTENDWKHLLLLKSLQSSILHFVLSDKP